MAAPLSLKEIKEVLIDPVVDRMDGHGARLQSIEEKTQSNHTSILKEFSLLRKEIQDIVFPLERKVTTMETERGLVKTIIYFLFGI